MSQKEQIAEAFERLVSRVGYKQANLDDLSRELHISKKTIYVHFDGKREIYAHVVEKQARLEQAKLRAMVADAASSREKVAMLLKFVIGSARAHVLETSKEEWLAQYEVAADVFAKANGDLLREIVEEGIAAGEFGAGDPDLVEKMVAAMVLQYTVLMNAQPDYDRDEELVERILRFVG